MPNQVNNVLAFPFLFRAALDVRASAINVPMMEAAARSIAQLAMQHPDGFGPERIIPSAFDDRLFETVSLAVARAAISSGIARRPLDLGVYKNQLGLRHRALMEKVAIWNGDSLDD
jgi:malate dehydrogenase (oxaloacetate-decarboxylating)(NADP+)